MSFFLLSSDTALESGADALDFAALNHEGRSLRVLPVGDMQLGLFGPAVGSDDFLYRNGDDFVAALGSLLYRGEALPQCLPQLLKDFDPATFDWEGLIGAHVVLVYRRGQLNVLTDGLGVNCVYTNEDRTVWSNSFLAICELTEKSVLEPQSCYEYVINGCVFGNRTPVRGVTSLPANSLLTIDGGRISVEHRPSPIDNQDLHDLTTLDAIADHHVSQLQHVFEPIARNYPDSLRLSFSGGFDSRLMLANLLKFGAKPTLFVYGNDQDEDVRIARLICKAEGLPLEVIDKGLTPAVDPDAFASETEENFFAFDGWKVESPMFDFGADRRDRLHRYVGGQVPLNGSLGEIYRNFFYMPDRASSTGAVVSTFFSRFDPRAFTDRFSEAVYRSNMSRAMREAIGTESDWLHRSQVEELYPKFRGRFWTGRDAQINQRFGSMFFPYLEHAAISNTAKIPIRFKDLGYLQGRMIGRANSRLANYPSDYGFSLDGPRPLTYRLKTYLSTQRPHAVRKLSFRLTNRRKEPRTGALAAAYLARVIDLEFPAMRKLFKIEAVNSVAHFGLIATLEYLAERYHLDVADD